MAGYPGDILESFAQLLQLFVRDAGILVFASFVPGAFADLTAVEQVPASNGRNCILSKPTTHTRLMIIKFFRDEMCVENGCIIWYHVGNLSVKERKQRWLYTLPGVQPFYCLLYLFCGCGKVLISLVVLVLDTY
jgi:hypothetical protein